LRFAVTADGNSGGQSYAGTARLLHWLMAVLVVLQIGAGLIMVYRGPEPNLWATLTDTLSLYSAHKLLGLILLALLLIRIAHRVGRGVPPEEPTLAVWQREGSRLVHAWIYLLLMVIPVLGWIGISLYPALVIFDAFAIPGLLPPDQPKSDSVFAAHKYAAFALASLIVVHVAAALYHHFIRGDGVLRRMWPGLGARGS
jgi:cytochrome b561